jgi:hypothetical protein
MGQAQDLGWQKKVEILAKQGKETKEAVRVFLADSCGLTG